MTIQNPYLPLYEIENTYSCGHTLFEGKPLIDDLERFRSLALFQDRNEVQIKTSNDICRFCRDYVPKEHVANSRAI